jgi:flagellar motility protein MotE (MotC chaperone)
MRLRPALLRPRLLPATIVAMAALLVCKSVLLVRAAEGETAQAMANEADTAAPPGPRPAQAPAPARPASVQPTEPPAAAVASPAAAPAAPAPVSDAERAVLLDVRRRHDALDERARELDQREADLAAADRRLSERVQQLTALQASLERLEAARRERQSENWSGLVKTYEAMKPRDAATIFDSLDMQVLLQVLDRMQERRAAPVLAAMQPDRARLATQMLAEMRTRASTPPPAVARAEPKG